MTIKKVSNTKGKEFFEVYVSVAHNNDKTKRTQKRKRFNTLAEAKKGEINLIRECEREIVEREMKGSSWGELIKGWEHHLLTVQDHRISKSVAEDYIGVLKLYTADWAEKPAVSLTPFDVRNVVQAMTERQLSNARKRGLLHAINGMFRWAIETRVLKPDVISPTRGVKVSRKEDKKPEILTLDEIRKFLACARDMQHDWYPIWFMAFHTGMRSGELFALEWKDVDWDSRILSVTKSYNRREKVIKETKSGYWRDVPINDELMTMLRDLKSMTHKRKRGQEFVLPRFRAWEKGEGARVTRMFLQGIGITSVKFHTLRACFATQLLRNAVPAAMVMKICGWSELKTMQYYVRLAGIEIQGATESLKFVTLGETMGQVIELFANP